MVIDTSVLIAILLQEPETKAFADAIATFQPCVISAATQLESSIVIWRKKGQAGLDRLNLLIQVLGIQVVAVDQTLIKIATEAFITYGKGQHKASLNFGDCFSYALAKSRNEPLLFKGQDFIQTDINIIDLSQFS